MPTKNGLGNEKIQILGVTKNQAKIIKNIVNSQTSNLVPNTSPKIPVKQKIMGFTNRSVGGEYNGYFKLILKAQPVSDEPGANVDYYVNIVDGATYDAEQNPVSGKSVCKVNNVTYQLDPYRSGMIAETSIFALKYTAPVAADPDAGTEAEPAKVEIVNLAEEGRSYLPSDTSENCWYQLGRAIVSANEDGTLNVTIQQDHQGTATNGIPQIWWYGLCED